MPEFDVVELESTDHPEAGDEAPDFVRPLVNSEFWEDVSLSDLLEDGPLLLIFHPMDGAFPATYIWNEVRNRGWTDHEARSVVRDGEAVSSSREAESASRTTSDRSSGERSDPRDRMTVVGLSVSSPYEHKRLIEERGIDARLFSDPQNGVAERYDIVNDLDGMAGVSEPRPAVFVIDGDRVVEYAWVASKWPDFPDYDEIEAALDTL